MENKVRYKLHKVKKQWVTLAVASVALATIVGASVATSSLASAEETNNLMDHLQQLRSGKIQILWLKRGRHNNRGGKYFKCHNNRPSSSYC